MKMTWFARTRALLRGAPALVASVVAAAALVAGGGPDRATKVALYGLCGLWFGTGQLYIAGGDVYGSAVRAVSPGAGMLTTAAGTGVLGPLGDAGPAAKASLLGACG